MSSDSDSASSSATAADSDDETTAEIAIITFERKMETARGIVDGIVGRYDKVDILAYYGDVFAEHWGEYLFVGLMASGITM